MNLLKETKEVLKENGKKLTECSVCGDRYSWGAYFEANNFHYCPKCGARMHPDKHLFDENREEPE